MGKKRGLMCAWVLASLIRYSSPTFTFLVNINGVHDQSSSRATK